MEASSQRRNNEHLQSQRCGVGERQDTLEEGWTIKDRLWSGLGVHRGVAASPSFGVRRSWAQSFLWWYPLNACLIGFCCDLAPRAHCHCKWQGTVDCPSCLIFSFCKWEKQTRKIRLTWSKVAICSKLSWSWWLERNRHVLCAMVMPGWLQGIRLFRVWSLIKGTEKNCHQFSVYKVNYFKVFAIFGKCNLMFMCLSFWQPAVKVN